MCGVCYLREKNFLQKLKIDIPSQVKDIAIMKVFYLRNALSHWNQNLLKRAYRTNQYVYGFNETSALQDRQQDLEKLKEVYSKRMTQPHVWQYIKAFRTHGHRVAQTNPLTPEVGEASDSVLELMPSIYFPDGLPSSDLDCLVHSSSPTNVSSIDELTTHLQSLYCGNIGAEFDYLEDPIEREWFAEAFESRENRYPIDSSRQIRHAQLMLKAQLFDKFLASKFTTVKRYSGEGAESLMVCFDEMLRSFAGNDVEAAVIGMPHRARNNLLTVLLNYPPALYFRKMKGKSEFPADVKATGDTFSHYYQATDLEYEGEGKIHVSLIPNPSHLEANISVAAGKARSKMQTFKDADYNGAAEEGRLPGDKAVCIMVHGDGSVTGQGIVQETLAFSQVPNYRVGGSIHLVVNNQVGFTTEAKRGRSSHYCSDIAKTSGCPVLHVNGEDPEAVSRASRLAVEFRQRFRRDIFIDLICYRRWGHNELDDPSFTQPIMYSKIDSMRSTPDAYLDQLVQDGVCTSDDVMPAVDKWQKLLNEELKNVDSYAPPMMNFGAQWSSVGPVKDSGLTVFNTGVDVDLLRQLGIQSVTLPGDFQVHSTLKRTFIDRRVERLAAGEGLDWATGEALAVATLLHEGHNCRISGQDVGRGTFSHRHFMLVDQESDGIHIPLNAVSDKGQLEVANSILSEEAVLGFEVGMSMDDPRNLVIWEAQFGDFFNGAQIIFDTYVSSAETKWLHQSGLVVILPHGYDGAGPEHSSCRIERFLQMTDSLETGIDSDDVNMHVINPTNPAQYFHALRRQLVRPFRKPLIVVAPKMLLRAPEATFSLSDVAPGTHFQHILPDPKAGSAPAKIEKVILCSGKHYYALVKHRDEQLSPEVGGKVAIIRLEQLAPFPACELSEELRKFTNAKSFVWSQEEGRNMGAWQFVDTRVRNLFGVKLKYAGRPEYPTPAVGIGERHRAEAADVLKQTFA